MKISTRHCIFNIIKTTEVAQLGVLSLDFKSFLWCLYLIDEGKSQKNSLQNNHSPERKEPRLNFRRISQTLAVTRASQWHLSKFLSIRATPVEKMESLGTMPPANQTTTDDNQPSGMVCKTILTANDA